MYKSWVKIFNLNEQILNISFQYVIIKAVMCEFLAKLGRYSRLYMSFWHFAIDVKNSVKA